MFFWDICGEHYRVYGTSKYIYFFSMRLFEFEDIAEGGGHKNSKKINPIMHAVN